MSKQKEDGNVKMAKDFGSIQKTFFTGVLMDYFKPIKTIFLFVSIPFELVRHFVINMSMDEAEHERYHQMKLDDEAKELMKNSTFENDKTE